MPTSTLRVQKVSAPSKLEALCLRLSSMAGALESGEKLPTVAQLCASLQVSPTTLNLALRELEGEGVIVRRNGVGLFVGVSATATRSRTVALVCDANYFRGAAHSPFWDLLVGEARARATLGNENFQLHFADAMETGDDQPLQPALMQVLRMGEVQGVLGVGLSLGAARWLRENGVPYVAFAGNGDTRIELDWEAFCELGAQQLARRGCCRVGLWTPIRPFTPLVSDWYLDERIAAFRAALENHGLRFDADLVRDNRQLMPNDGDITRLSHQEQGFYSATEVWQSEQRPDGVLIGDDLMTVGALTALANLGARVGHDLQIVTHANYGSTTLLGHEKSLTRLQYDPREIALAMFEQLEAAMSGAILSEVVTVRPTLAV